MVNNNVTVTFIHLYHLSLNIFLEFKSSNRVNCNVWILTDTEWHDSWRQQVWLHPHLTVCFPMNKFRSHKNQTIHANRELRLIHSYSAVLITKTKLSLGWHGENVRFGVLTVVLTKKYVFWDKALLVSSYQHKDSILLHCDALLLGKCRSFKEF